MAQTLDSLLGTLLIPQRLRDRLPPEIREQEEKKVRQAEMFERLLIDHGELSPDWRETGGLVGQTSKPKHPKRPPLPKDQRPSK